MVSSWTLGTTVFDFDETVAVRKKILGKGDFSLPQGWHITEWQGELYAFMIRPSTRPCLEALLADGFDIAVLTYSNKPSRTAHFIKTAGLDDLIPVSSIWGRDCAVPEPTGPWVLIDNLPPSTGSVRHKLRQLGLKWDIDRRVPYHAITCNEFTGHGDTSPLIHLLPQIDHRMFAQAGWSLGAEIEPYGALCA
jgi:hypothetical protein